MTGAAAARGILEAVIACAEGGVRLQASSPLVAMAREWLSTEPNGEETMAKEEKHDALAISGADYKMALEPQSFADAMQVASQIAEIGLCGARTPAEVIARVMAGRSVGLTFMQSMREVYIIEERPTLSARAKVALCLRSPMCERFECVETTAEKAVYAVKRRGGDEKRFEYTIQDAERSLLLDRGKDEAAKAKSNWNRFRPAMLRARCSSMAADTMFPDVVTGFDTAEEMRDEEELEGEIVEPTTQQPVTPARDYAAEAKALLAKIDTITAETPPTARKPIRDEVLAWDGIEPWKSTVTKAYNDTPRYSAQKAAAAPPAAAPESSRAPAAAGGGAA